MELSIPQFIDMYNHYMNGVDNADQLRSYYRTQRTHNKNWKPLWHFLLDIAITNAYKIAHCDPERPHGYAWHHHTHKRFRAKLAADLFANSERIGAEEHAGGWNLEDNVVTARDSDHKLVRMKHRKYCVACLCAGRKSKETTTRKALGQISGNARRRQRAPLVWNECELCGIAICDSKQCMSEHLKASKLPK